MMHVWLNYLLYFACAMTMLVGGAAVYVICTPLNEVYEIMTKRNPAAAWALGGFLVGYAIVIYTVTAHGTPWPAMMGWSAVALLVQVAVCEIAFHLIGLKQAVETGDEAAGIALGAASLAVGLVNAGCLT